MIRRLLNWLFPLRDPLRLIASFERYENVKGLRFCCPHDREHCMYQFELRDSDGNVREDFAFNPVSGWQQPKQRPHGAVGLWTDATSVSLTFWLGGKFYDMEEPKCAT